MKTGLWGGRFEGRLAAEMEPINISLPVDGRLWREEIRGSVAWARALGRAGVLDDDETREIVGGLKRVGERLGREGWNDALDEDIHSLVERLLGDEVGALAGKLHTGRSRNDQSATGTRLWGMAASTAIEADLTALVRALTDLAGDSVELVMPGYTHLQRAQPVRAAQWVLSHAFPLLRDLERMRQTHRAASVLPLGAGALAGCPFPVDREAIGAELGFRRVSENSMDTVSDRDWMSELAYASALLGVHLSRLGEDIVLFSSSEFGFVRLSDGFSTGSSLMPQKRNPDLAELARGKSARLIGNLVTLLTLSKGLPTGYNRDLQEDKEAVFDSVDTLAVLLPAMTGAVSTLTFDPGRMSAALDEAMLATDLADHLVRKGVPFRETHEIVGGLVRRAEALETTLASLPPELLANSHPALAEDLADVFDFERSVEARDTAGGTSKRAVLDQLAEVGRRLEVERQLDTQPSPRASSNTHPT